MGKNRIIRLSLGIVVACLTSFVAWSQTGSTGSAATTMGSNSSTTGSSGPNQTIIKIDRSTQTQDLRQLATLFITGAVILDNGSVPPAGVVIERVCSGLAVRETNLGPDGSFSFQLGQNLVLPDVSDGSKGRIWDPIMGTSIMTATGLNTALLADCKLRAHLAGYQSNTLDLNINQTMGNYRVGTLVLYPAARIKGTTVSSTSLAAPKKSKKALEMAWKALQRKDTASAERQLLAALAQYPNYAAAWCMLGELNEMALRIEDARIAFKKAVAADANFVTPYVELARIAAIGRRWQESADLSASALQLNPIDFPYAYYLNALSNHNLSRLDLAERSLRTLADMDLQHRYPEAHVLRANIFRERYDSVGEADQLRAYLKYSPTAANAPQIRARLERLEGR
jgi:tetratricopeptide (TPR) repeat protein